MTIKRMMGRIQFGYRTTFGCRGTKAKAQFRSSTAIACLLAAALGCGQSQGNDGSDSTAAQTSASNTGQLVGESIANTKISEASGKAVSSEQQESQGAASDLQDTLDSTQSHYPAVRLESYAKLGNWPVEMGSKEVQEIAKTLYRVHADEYNDFDDHYIDMAFRSLDEKAVAEVERLIATKDDDNIMQAVVMMRGMGEKFCEKLTPAIDTLLKSDDPAHVWQGMYTLEGMGTAGKTFIDQIVPQTQSSDFQAQQIALRVLAVIGPDANEHLAGVRRLADEGQNLSVKSHAMIAMGKISAGGPEAKAVAEQLTGYLDANSFIAKQRALTGLIALKQDATAAQDKAKSLMETDKSGLAAQAAYVYGLTSGDWETTVSKLSELTRDPTVGLEALDFIKQIGPDAKAATEMLLTVTRSDDESVTSPAVEALISIYREPKADDENFKKVAQRFAELAEEVTETGYIAEQQWKLWKEAGLVSAESKQESK